MLFGKDYSNWSSCLGELCSFAFVVQVFASSEIVRDT